MRWKHRKSHDAAFAEDRDRNVDLIEQRLAEVTERVERAHERVTKRVRRNHFAEDFAAILRGPDHA